MNANAKPNYSLADTPVGELVAERPARARVFENFGMDYCCGGKKPLREACEQAGQKLETVTAFLLDCDAAASAPEPETDWTAAPLADLADHIVQTHHAWLRRELPRLEGLMEKVARAHGGDRPEVLKMRAVLAELAAELGSHMLKEERILFPMAKALEADPESVDLPSGALDCPIRQMEHEHDDAGAALRRLRELSGGSYAPPEGACPTFQALYGGLAELEADLHRHIHKENNILFPRASKLEAERWAKPGSRS